VCQRNKPANRKEPLMIHDVPKHRLLKVGSDVLYHGGHAYLIIVDYMSDFIELKRLEDKTAASVIDACKEIFARHGVPEIFQSDNALYYNYTLLQKFAEDWRFTHTTSSPGHLHINGKAESTVKIIKHLLNRSDDSWKALMEWHATPNRDFPSLSERLYGRKLRTLVPQPQEALGNQDLDLDQIARARRIRQQRMMGTYNRNKNQLTTLQHGQPVMVKQVNERIAK